MKHVASRWASAYLLPRTASSIRALQNEFLTSRPPSIWKIQPFHQSDSKKKWQLHCLKLPWHFLKWARLRCLCLVSVLPASHIPGQPESRPVMQDASYRRVIDGRALSQKRARFKPKADKYRHVFSPAWLSAESWSGGGSEDQTGQPPTLPSGMKALQCHCRSECIKEFFSTSNCKLHHIMWWVGSQPLNQKWVMLW